MQILKKSFLLLLLTACGNPENTPVSTPQNIQTGEYITRKQDEFRFIPLAAHSQPPPAYPWTSKDPNAITKYHFRCKGCLCNPPLILDKNGQKHRIYDCEGDMQHSLPVRDGKEFVYPILIDILNYIQNRAQQPVIITSGHRCPEHNAYVDPSPKNYSSKHIMGAEVSFYVQNYERQPQKIIEWIRDYYTSHPSKSADKDFTAFQISDKSDLRTKPLSNKEIFIKTYLSYEGRNKDNTHNFPYLSIQVRWDESKNTRVTYTPQPLYRN
ncbi:MAG: D-Ala-D-Ala carboxypeptidase family metallohydrolase [Parachlamydiales bacterium]|jgi:hypothetical protein